jgi:hypothetical protein
MLRNPSQVKSAKKLMIPTMSTNVSAADAFFATGWGTGQTWQHTAPPGSVARDRQRPLPGRDYWVSPITRLHLLCQSPVLRRA